MTKTQEQKYKEKKLDILLNEQYNLKSEVAFSVNLILGKRKELEGAEKRHTEALNDFKLLEVKIDKENSKEKKKKYSEEQKKELGLARNKYQGEEFILTALKGKISKLNEEVAVKANSIRAIQKNIDFLDALELDKVPQLEYLEINGTQYQAKDNAHVLDENGSMILYVKPNGKSNSTQKAA